jgi:hypothetical protein
MQITLNYPATLDIDYPDRELNRLTTFFRPFVAVSILMVLCLVFSYSFSSSPTWFFVGSGGILFFPTLVMILFRQNYHRWWFDWNVALMKFSTRYTAYLLLMRDEYPSTDEEKAVHIEIPYPDATIELGESMPLVSGFLRSLTIFFCGRWGLRDGVYSNCVVCNTVHG